MHNAEYNNKLLSTVKLVLHVFLSSYYFSSALFTILCLEHLVLTCKLGNCNMEGEVLNSKNEAGH